MSTQVKSIGIDMGNSTIGVTGLIGKDVKHTFIQSIYTTDTALTSGDVIEYQGVKIALGVGQSTLTNVDKTNREYIEHQILWSVKSIYGTGKHYIKLGIGLPISIYKAKKEDYMKQLNEIKCITGTINGQQITINLVGVSVYAEGHAAIKPLAKFIDKDNTTLIIDIGMKTTDVLLVEYINGKFSINKFATINIALYDIYNVLKSGINAEGIDITIDDIDRRFKSKKPIIRTEKGEYDLEKHLPDAKGVCMELIKNIENIFGKTVLHDKLFIGGGASKFIKAINTKIKNNIEVKEDLRYYANSLGYFLNVSK